MLLNIKLVMSTIHDREWVNITSEKEKNFLLTYARTGDLQESARAADYAETSISWIGDRIMSRAEAREELRLIRDELGYKEGSMSQEELIEEFKTIATATITDFYDDFGDVIDVTQMDPIKARAIKEIKRTVNPKSGAVTVVVTMHDKISALQNLGRIGGHYAADNGDKTGDVNIQIVLPGGLSKI